MEHAAPISEDEEIGETDNFKGNFEPEEPCQMECTLVETNRTSMHSQTPDLEQEERRKTMSQFYFHRKSRN